MYKKQSGVQIFRLFLNTKTIEIALLHAPISLWSRLSVLKQFVQFIQVCHEVCSICCLKHEVFRVI